MEILQEDRSNTLPDMSTPPAKRDEVWHKRCIQHYSTFYNVRRRIFDTDEAGYQLSALDEMKENYAYVLGRQKNKDYAFMTTDPASNTQDELGIISGQKVAQLIEWMRGKFQEMISNMDMEAVDYSPEAKTKEIEMFDKLMLKYLLKPELKQIENMGVQFNPANGFNPTIQEEIFKFMDRGFKGNTQTTSKSLAHDILNQNHYKSLFLMAATHVLATARTGVDVTVNNGDIKWNLVPAHHLILDTSVDDDMLRNMRFGGYVQYKSYAEAITHPNWKFTNDEKEFLRKLSQGQAIGPESTPVMWHDLNTHSNFNWWDVGAGGQYNFACVKMYWQTIEDAGYKKSRDKYGNNKMYPRDLTDKMSDVTFQGWRQGVLIGNMFLKEFGKVTNMVGALSGRPENDIPLKVFMPNMLMGENRSMVDRLKNHQARIDAFRRKVTDLMARNKGRGVIINGALAGIKNGDKIIADLARDGITVVNLEPGEPGEDPMRAFSRDIDLTGDPTIRFYIDLIREEERNMEEISNIPKMAQGTQQGYVGAGVQDRTLSQSNLGTATTFNGFVDWASGLIQYSTNVRRFAMTADKDNYQARLKIGDYGYQYAKITRDIRLEDVGLWFKVQDVIDEAARGRIRSYAQAFSQNPEWNVEPDDILNLEKARTWTEMIDNLQYSMKRNKRIKEQEQAYRDLIEQVNAERQSKAMKDAAELQAITSQNNNREKIAGDIVKTAVKENPEMIGAEQSQQ